MAELLDHIQNTDIDKLDPKSFILIKNARVNNLRDLSVAIPRNKLIVITGLSGSGKSSLAFDTLFAEGQRMYVESLSSYARQFLGRMEKPEVEYIKGVSPAIAIEQKVNTRNPRSTVGTTTEIYDYLKLLFARIGITYSPVSQKKVKKNSVEDVVDFIFSHANGTRFSILYPLKKTKGRTPQEQLAVLLQQGFSRVLVDGKVTFIEELLNSESLVNNIEVLIDRSAVEKDSDGNRNEDNEFRISDSIQTGFFEGEGQCIVELEEGKRFIFSDKFEMDGIIFEEPSVNFFSFNNPYGACRNCEGFGKILGIDEELVIPDKSLSIFEGAIAPWRSETMKRWLTPLINQAHEFDFPLHRSVKDLNSEEYDLLWNGKGSFKGISAFFKRLESKTHKIQYRVLLSRYRGRTTCPDCKGTRLRKDASYVKIDGHSITDLSLMPVSKMSNLFENLSLDPHRASVAKRLLDEITHRLQYLNQVGLGYLTLNRLTSTLSGGEYQRIKLSTSLGSALVGSMYILDEPSIGLHPRDTQRLIEVLKTLRDLGNTVIVVEHEEEIMRAADQIIDIGPDAGSHGGKLVFQGNLDDIRNKDNTHTARYLNGIDRIHIPTSKRKWKDKILIKGARENNLKNIDVEIPMDVLTVITGVSGSGKSTLISSILYPAIGKMLGVYAGQTGHYDEIDGDFKKIKSIEFVDQNPIGKSSRSNPVTYIKAYDAIRQLYAEQPLSKQRAYKPSNFSFNVDGGRCEMCEGDGIVKIEMQFMADLELVCESCHGKRFKQEILDVTYQDKNIADILEMTVEESLEFFNGHNPLVRKLKPLFDVGLGYIRLGQSSNSLSGGEAQRVKLASFLGKNHRGDTDHCLFIFDEPTTGLHFHDISQLLKAINELVEQGHSVIIIEHNTEVIKSADWVIDLGPEGGEEGGSICFAGTPEKLALKAKTNHTAGFLKDKFH